MQKSVKHNNNSPRFIIRNAANVISNVQEIIREILPNSWVEAAELAPKVFKKNSQQSELEICRAIWNYTKANFKYKEDPVGIEYIRYVSKSIQDAKKGIDCEDFCIIGSSLLTFKNVKHYFKIIKYIPDPNNPKSASEVKEWRHIYLIVKIGNKEIILDSCAETFNDSSVNQYIAEERLFEIPQFRKNQHNGLSGIIKYNHFGTKTDIINPVSDPNWAKVLYDQPTNNDIDVFEKYLKKHQDSFVLMYHGTSPSYDILNQGIKVTSDKRRNSQQSTAGFVYLTPLPEYAKSYGQYANGHTKEPIIYQVKIPISSLLPDLDNLTNQKLYAGLKVKNSVANSLSFAHSCRVKGNIPPYLLAVHEGEKGLGVLEKQFHGIRENFLLALWQQMVRDGATVLPVSKTDNTLPTGYTFETFGDYVKMYFSDFKIEKIYGEKFYNSVDRYRFSKDNTTVGFVPESLYGLVVATHGQKEADYKLEIERRVVSENEVSPYNKALMAFMKPFVSNDDYHKPMLTGVSFDDKGVVATDGFKVLFIENNTVLATEKGIFKPETLEVMDGKYVDYEPNLTQEQPYFIELDIDKFITNAKLAMLFKGKGYISITMKVTPKKIFITGENADYGHEAGNEMSCKSNAVNKTLVFNGKMMIDCLKVLKKLKIKQTKLVFSGYDVPMKFQFPTPYGNATMILSTVFLIETENIIYNNDSPAIINPDGSMSQTWQLSAEILKRKFQRHFNRAEHERIRKEKE